MWPARTVRSPEPQRSRPSAPTTSRRTATTSGGSCSTTASPSGRTASRTPVSRCCAGRRGSSPPTRRHWQRRRRCSPAGATRTRRSSTIGSPQRPPVRIRPSRATNATRSRTPGISWCAGSRGTQLRSGSCGCGPASTPCNVESPATRPCWRGCSPPQSRKTRGTRLAPADQQLFTRDSTARAQGVAQRREHLTASLGQIAADSSALVAAFAPAIDALSDYVAAYPGEPEAAIWLATLYAQSGRGALAAAVFDSLAAHAPELEPDALFGPGGRMVEQGLYRAGARALTLGLARNPYRRDALFSLAVAHYQLRDSAALLPVAQRLLVLDPLNRASLKLVAAGWDFGGRRDSTRAYVARADTGLAVEISVPSFVPDSAGASLSGIALSLKSAPTTPFHLTVEFLDASGQVVATAAHDVTSLPPRQ